ncbi:hypothetical protein DFJ73DRAFT_858377 [Zopfochytrium polystomum]|nr:hypothetical protein DFJ73DRAFT_858377 [Zopfochytrium polystomum]
MSENWSAGNQAIAGAVLSTVVAICFCEQIDRIESLHMKVSIWAALFFYFVQSAFGARFHYWLDYADRDNIGQIFDFGRVPMILTGAMFACLAYHAAYRAFILLAPGRTHWHWVVASAVALYEFALNVADSTLFSNNLKANHGTVPDPTQGKTSTALIVSVCALDTFFFVASQYRIISVMGKVNNVKPTITLYVDAFLRCTCFSGAVLMFYISTAGYFYPTNVAWVFLQLPGCIMIIVLLTDSDRVRKLLTEMQQPVHVDASILQSSKVENSKSGVETANNHECRI